jgi:hypothetical protein
MDDLERQVEHAASKQQRWSNVGAVAQARENADTAVESKAKWSKIYRLFGASSENQQDEVFAAVNLYFLVNGASPKGKYMKPVRTAGGVEVPSGEVVKITGRLPGELRQFLRGRLEDSYVMLKHNPVVKEDEDLATVAENAGVPRALSWLLADWLGRDCKYFVGIEGDIYNKLRSSKIRNAYDKQAVAQDDVDLVREYAPEAKMVASHGGAATQQYNNDLF